MRITIKNLGPLERADFELGDLTVICGMNNTGKTYATYALYGFLEYWASSFIPRIPKSLLETLYTNGKAMIPLGVFVEQATSDLKRASEEFSKTLDEVFASKRQRFEDSSISIAIPERPVIQTLYPKSTLGSRMRDVFRIQQIGSSFLEVTLLVEKDKPELVPPRYFIEYRVADAVKKIVYGNSIPRSYISSAERTGATIFRSALNSAAILTPPAGDANLPLEHRPWNLLRDLKHGYALPVKRNIEFIRNLDDIEKNDSFLALHAPQVLDDFADIIGGTYKVVRGEPYFIPKFSRGIRLSMDESSSAVRSLLDVGLYLRHVARLGDLMMIDEPELNLHPENQRKIARLLASLVNLGLKVFITTHSDYIIKELSALLLLSSRQKHQRRFMKANGYGEGELIAANRIRVYMTKPVKPSTSRPASNRAAFTLEKAQVGNELGIIVGSFDDTIDKMNFMQQEILFGGDEDS